MCGFLRGVHDTLPWNQHEETTTLDAERKSLQWRHSERDGVSNHQHHGCFPKRLFRRRWKKISKLRVTGLCAGNSPVTGEFPAKRASNAENVSIWWRHHVNEVTFSIMDYLWCGLTQGICASFALSHNHYIYIYYIYIYLPYDDLAVFETCPACC